MITITNNNIFYSEFPLSTLISLDNVRVVEVEDIISFLSDTVELGESVTFKRLFNIISLSVDKFNEVFNSSLGGADLGPFLQEIENNPTEKIDSDYLEIHWFSEKFKDELNIVPSLHGRSEKDDQFYAMDFVSLNNIKNHLVKINETVEISDYTKVGDDEEAKIIKINLGNKKFTVFDLFNAILYEISFHGGPQDKKERFAQLEDSIDEIKSKEEDSEDLLTFEELIEKFESGDEYLVKYKELRDRVEESRITNKANLDKLKNCLLEKLKIYDEIDNFDGDLKPFYKKITDLEYSMQILYGESEDKSCHRFWETPKCTCPKIDNLEIYPSEEPIFDSKCPIHGK